MKCRIDHITVTAPSLEAGSDLVFARLGVRPQRGGSHPRMGTHNLLLRIGAATFLEVIAIDPAAAAPARPRWFELDQVRPGDSPRLACWVARTDDIRASAEAATLPLGPLETMSRGELEWRITIPKDGSLPMQGVAPALIQWHARPHPAQGLADVGCRLVALGLFHPDPAAARELLASLQMDEPGVQVTVQRAAAPGIVAHIQTPTGLRYIGAAPATGDMLIRTVQPHELQQLLSLYTHLHTADDPLPDDASIQGVWHELLANPRYQYFGGYVDGLLVSSCTLTTIPNLTRGCRPYGVIENVVTHEAYRRQGRGQALLAHALAHAWSAGCYKVMLMTGRKDDATLRFYESAGFDRHDKQAFVAKPSC